MTRRVSVELIRREFRLSIKRRAAGSAEARPENAAADETVRPNTPVAAECPSCASPWFPLPPGGGEEPAVLQRALEKHGIHTLLSPAGELLVCGRSFELHAGAIGVTDAVATEPGTHETETGTHGTEPGRQGDLPPDNSAGH